MTKAWKVLAAAMVVGLGMTAGGPFGAALDDSARAAAGHSEVDAVAARIDGAFVSLPDAEPDPAVARAAGLAVKGDLAVDRDCAAAAWPNIPSACLLTADGAPAPAVRFITIGRQSGATTVLMRVPSQEVATR
jgi:hypothetical protein